MTTIDKIQIDAYKAEASRYLDGLPNINLEANLQEAKKNQTAYAQTQFAYSAQGFSQGGQPLSCPQTAGICDCCVLYKDDCSRS